MVTPAQCNCGWRAELSAHYQGRRIRCPSCDNVLNLAGKPQTPLYGAGWTPPQADPAPGQWVPVSNPCGSKHCAGGKNFGVFLVIAMVAMISLVRQCKQGADDRPARPHAAPSEKVPPQTAPKEDEF